MSYMEAAMRTVSAREANQSFSKLMSEVEGGETVVVTKRGRPAMRLTKIYADKREDPAWQAAHARLLRSLEALRLQPDTGFRVGVITEEDKRGRHWG